MADSKKEFDKEKEIPVSPLMKPIGELTAADIPAIQKTVANIQTANKNKLDRGKEAIGIYPKKFMDVYGKSKYYLKFRPEFKKQVESVDPKTGLAIMVYDDDFTECAYYENLTEADVKFYTELEAKQTAAVKNNG